MNTDRINRRTSIRPRKQRSLFGRTIIFATLLVACFLVGFFGIGPRLHKSDTAKDLKVESTPVPHSPSSEDSRADEPPVQVIQRKVIKPVEGETNESDSSKGIKLEIEHPVSPQDQDTPVDTDDTEPLQEDTDSGVYRVEVKGFADETTAGKAADDLSSKGYAPIVNRVITDSGTEYRVQVGAFKNKDNANRVADDIRTGGLDATVAGPDQ